MNSVNRRDFLGGSLATLGVSALTGSARAAAEPPFKLGLVTYMVAATWDLPTLLRVCKNAGIAAVELRTMHAHKVEPTLSKAERQEIKAMFAQSGVVFWGCGSVAEFHSADPKVVQKNIDDCKRFVELVADLGGVEVKVRPNGFVKGVEEAVTLKQIAKALRECGDFASSAGIEIQVEVHGNGTQLPKNMHTIMSECNHKAVGITWNSNPTDVVNGSIAASFALLKPWLMNVHINDLENDPKKKYPYRELFKLLREAKYNRYTLIEYAKSFPKPEEGEAFLIEYKKKWLELAS